jgi:hypothetical protein
MVWAIDADLVLLSPIITVLESLIITPEIRNRIQVGSVIAKKMEEHCNR